MRRLVFPFRAGAYCAAAFDFDLGFFSDSDSIGASVRDRFSPELAEQLGLPAGYRLRQVIGTADFTLQPNRDLDQHFGALGIVHDYVEVPGVGHVVPDLVAALGETFWAFHRDALREVDTLLADGFE